MGKTGALKYGTGCITTKHGGTQHCLSSTFLRARFEQCALLCVRGSSSRAMTPHGARPAQPRRVSAGSPGTGPNPPFPHPVTAEPRPALTRVRVPRGAAGTPPGHSAAPAQGRAPRGAVTCRRRLGRGGGRSIASRRGGGGRGGQGRWRGMKG